MNGKKFVVIFALFMAFSGAFLAVWIKQAYDSRPQIKIEDKK